MEGRAQQLCQSLASSKSISRNRNQVLDAKADKVSEFNQHEAQAQVELSQLETELTRCEARIRGERKRVSECLQQMLRNGLVTGKVCAGAERKRSTVLKGLLDDENSCDFALEKRKSKTGADSECVSPHLQPDSHRYLDRVRESARLVCASIAAVARSNVERAFSEDKIARLRFEKDRAVARAERAMRRIVRASDDALRDKALAVTKLQREVKSLRAHAGAIS